MNGGLLPAAASLVLPELTHYYGFRMNKSMVGVGLLVSAALALIALAVVSVVMAEDYLGSGRLTSWSYAASWLNGILGFYAWMAGCLGIKLALKTRDAFAHNLVLVVMSLGILVFAFSGYSEVCG